MKSYITYKKTIRAVSNFANEENIREEMKIYFFKPSFKKMCLKYKFVLGAKSFFNHFYKVYIIINFKWW